MIKDCLGWQPDVVTILCTNMNGASAAARLEGASGGMVLDSVAVTLCGCLMAVGCRTDMIKGYGRIFSDARLNT